MWQDIIWIRETTWWLSISGRCEEFINGLICSEDVIYFVMVSALFLTLAILRTSNRRKARPARIQVLGYAGAVLFTCFIGFLSSRPHLMWFHDSTETKKQTITVPSQEVMARVKGPVVMTTYSNILDEEGFYLGVPSRYNSDKAYIKQYLRFKPDIKIKYEYYWADAGSKSVKRRWPDLTDYQRAERIADVYEMNIDKFQSLDEISRKIDLSGEGYRFVRNIVMDDGRSTFLRVFDDSQRLPQEKEITAAFKRLIDGAIPVGFVTGHGERDIHRESDRDYYAFAIAKRFRHSLINNGFDALEISLEKEIPDNVKILVIADPRTRFTKAELKNIRNYIASGRNVILAAEPGRQDIANQVASIVGAEFNKGRLVVPEGDNMQNLTLGNVTEDAVKRAPSLRSLRKHDYKITMPDAVGINTSGDNGFENLTLIESAPESWNELQTIDFANSVASYNPASGEIKGSAPVAVQMERKMKDKTQKILLLGDADCFSNAELMRERYSIGSGNFSLLYEMFRWLSDGQYPCDTPRAKGSDNTLDMDIDSLPLVRWTFVLIIPLVMLIASILIIIRRKSK